MVADVLDAVTSVIPYHLPMNYGEAIAEIHGKNGTHFEPMVVDIFEYIQPEKLETIKKRYADLNKIHF
jgi:response regulator RpfG family c-di-GMP phosphodiesterase